MIECVESGLVYRNPKPNVCAKHTWHPSLALGDSGDIVCAFDMGQAVESLDYRTYVSRSADGGRTWSEPARMFIDPVKDICTHTARIAAVDGGELVAMGGRFYRPDPEEGLTNRACLGFTKTDLIQLRSHDEGRTWIGPDTVAPPLVGPGFEVCHAVVTLRDGRWLWPCSTWKGWDGDAPNGMKAIALVSLDRGHTWPEHLEEFDDYANGIVHWEQSLVQLPDDRLLAVSWALHEATGKALPTPYTISNDGRTFAAPRPTGLHGQTTKLCVLPDGRVLALYRHDSEPGLWANVSHVNGEEWVNDEGAMLWGGAAASMGQGGKVSDELGALKFGFPQMKVLPDGAVFAAFWCLEDCVHNIRWLRVRVT